MAIKSVCIASLLLCIVLVWGAKPSDTECEAMKTLMDRSTASAMLVTSPDLKPFKDVADLEETYCNLFMGWVRSIGAYKACLKAFQKSVFSIIVSNMKKNYKSFCTVDVEKENIVQHSQCFTLENRDKLSAVVNKLTGLVEYVADRPDPNEMIPGLCCGIVLLGDYLENGVDAICNNTASGLTTGQFTKMIINANTAEALDIMCGNFGTVEACRAKPESKMDQLVTVLETANYNYNHTAFVSLLRFIEKMDSAVNVQ